MTTSILRKAVAVSAAFLMAAPALAQAAPAAAPSTPDPNTQWEAPRDQVADGHGPIAKNYIDATLKGGDPNQAPVGVNDWSCKPTKKRPNPVILVHGWGSRSYGAFSAIGPLLKQKGFCVFATTYGLEKNKSIMGSSDSVAGVADTWTSAMQVADYVEAVRKATGAKKVDMVAWSQGGLIVQTYLNFYNGGDRKDPSKNRVGRVVYFGGAHHGTDMSGIGSIAVAAHEAGLAGVIDPIADKIAGVATFGMLTDSPIVKANLEAGDTIPGITYTIIGSETDMVVTPLNNMWLKQGPGATVYNVNLQEGCAKDRADHHAMVYDPRALDYMLSGLGVQNVTPRCEAVSPFIAQGF